MIVLKVLYVISLVLCGFSIYLGFVYYHKSQALSINVNWITSADKLLGVFLYLAYGVAILVILLLPIVNIVFSYYLLSDSNNVYKNMLKKGRAIDEHYYTDKFKTLKKALINQNILTEQQIDEIISSYEVANKLINN